MAEDYTNESAVGASAMGQLVFILLVCFILAAIGLEVSKDPAHGNRLVLQGADATIPLYQPFELDGLTKEQVLDLRRRRIAPYIGQYLDLYEPSKAVFGQIVDGLPWWGLAGLYRFGPGHQAIAGPSEETRMIANPLLLVTLLESSVLAAQVAPAGLFPWPYPQSLQVMPGKNEMVLQMAVGGFLRHLTENFPKSRKNMTMAAYNARDLGFDYLIIEGANLKGVIARTDTPVPLIQFIHRGNSCRYPGGCNNMSPHVPGLDIELVSLPAVIPIVLRSVNGRIPDIRYRIELK